MRSQFFVAESRYYKSNFVLLFFHHKDLMMSLTFDMLLRETGM